MIKLITPKALATVRGWGIKHSPAICTGIGIALGIVTVVEAVKETPKALYLIEEEKKRFDKEDLTPVETVKAAWKPYILPTTTGLMSIAFVILGQRIYCRRNAALAAAISLSETAFSEYQDKVKETFGEKKEQKVRDDIAQDTVVNHPPKQEDIVLAGKGNTLFYDKTSGRYFMSDLASIERGINRFNQELVSSMYCTLNELYYEWGLAPTSIGEELGWKIDNGLIELRPISTMLSDDGRPCIVLDFNIRPTHQDWKFY